MASLIEIRNVSVSYNEIRALSNLNLQIREGEYLGIVGPNGGGKSTLLKTILNLISLTEGEITYHGLSMKKSKIRFGYVPQISEINRLFPITVQEVVLSGKMSSKIIPFYRYSEKDKLDVLDLLDKVGIRNLASRQISELSGGEFQKMLIARALAVNPTILLLDEPTAMIDNVAQKQIFRVLKRLSADMTIVIVTHQIQAITRQVTRLIYLEKNVIADGNPIEVYNVMYRQSAMNIIGARFKPSLTGNEETV
jgi:zinc transport system ATP-binding protein